MQRRLWMVLLTTALTTVLGGDTAPATPPDHRNSPAATAIQALTAPAPSVPAPSVPAPGASASGVSTPADTAPADLAPGARASSARTPGDFEAVMGYSPVREHGRWVAPKGACSAPTGATRYDFSGPCKAHDLGYDLLRYAARVGEPLGPWAREAIDAAFGRALAARCRAVGGSAACRATAAMYHGVVVANSWRQDWRDPRPEPWLPWVLVAAVVTLAPVGVNAVIARRDRGSRRRDG
ncbi:phospholipase A2 [Cryptosporangium japonicum]|uniref:Phospholipase A2 n=1 Tax=Cryptosporangium japonicum TaxID=80872 RepID=A0ABP3EA89_9ACTN